MLRLSTTTNGRAFVLPKVTRSQELTLTQPTSTVDDNDEDYDYDGVPGRVVHTAATHQPLPLQAVVAAAAAAASEEWIDAVS
jgi:hypothetical protein